MSNILLTVDCSRGQARVRLVFANALAGGAFTSASLYGATSADGNGPNPTSVVAVFAVSGSSNIVELALEPAMTPGGLYTFSCTNVPCADLSNFTGSIQGRTGLPISAPVNAELATSDLDQLLYGEDLVFTSDFGEDATGDLDTVSGRGNWFAALNRRMTSSGLLWDPNYSPRADRYVNAPDAYKQPLAGILVAQAAADDRTKQATCTVAPFTADTTGNGWLFQLTVVGRDGLDPLTLSIPPADVVG